MQRNTHRHVGYRVCVSSQSGPKTAPEAEIKYFYYDIVTVLWALGTQTQYRCAETKSGCK